MEKLMSIERAIGKKSRITLLDRLKNAGMNIAGNPFTFLFPLAAACALYGAIDLGINSSRLGKLNKGYNQAYAQSQNITGALNSNTNFWQTPPLSAEIFEPIKKSIDLSLSRQNSNEGQEIRGLVEKVQETMYLPQPEGTNQPSREFLMTQLNEKLKPLSEASGNHGALSAISSLGVILFGLCSALAYSGANFMDHNDSKKKLRKRSLKFFQGVKKSVKEGDLDKESVDYLGGFFEKMDLTHINYVDMTDLLATLGENLRSRSKPLLKTLSEHPCYDSSLLEDLCETYHNLRREDETHPLERSRLKSRKDLFLDVWSRNKNSHSRRYIVETISTSLSYERTVPEILDALIQGTIDISEIKKAHGFLYNTVISDDKIAKRLVKHYLQTPGSPSLPEDLGFLKTYADRRLETLTPSESLSLLSELETLRTFTGEPSYSYWLHRQENEGIIDIAREIFKKNPLLASKIILEGHELFIESPLKRDLCEQIVLDGFIPTPYLVKRLDMAKDRKAELGNWNKTREEIRQGGFDPSDELKRNIEYTHYCIEATKLRKNSDFESYQAVLEGTQND